MHVIQLYEHIRSTRLATASTEGTTEMQDLIALMNTVPGDVTLEVFAKKAGWAKAAMRAEITTNAALAAYFCQMVAHAMREVPA